TYDWAIEQREKDNCIISGFHSKIEKDVFHILLKGDQPIILALARGLMQRYEPETRKSIENGRLLVLSPFEEKVVRVNRANANIRNELICEITDSIFVPYATPGEDLDKLLKKFIRAREMGSLSTSENGYITK
ncbi:DNA-binding protein, partial [Bacteroidota bacterium]